MNEQSKRYQVNFCNRDNTSRYIIRDTNPIVRRYLTPGARRW